MTVRIIHSIAGHADPANGMERDFAFRPGEQIELPDGLAAKWIGSKLAAPVTVAAPIKDAKGKAKA